MSFRSASLVIAASLASCGGAQRTGAASSSDAPRTAPLDVRAHTLIVPTIAAPLLLAREPGGIAYFAVGGIRVRLHGSDALAADQPFASNILAAAQLRGRGWYFVDAAGTVGRSEDFTATMHFERALGEHAVRAYVRDGGLYAVLASGRTVRADTERPATEPVPSAPSSVAPTSAPDAELQAVAAAALARFPLARLVLPSTVLLGSGDVAIRGGSDVYFASLTPEGALRATGRVALTHDAAGECGFRAWGARALLLCPDVPPSQHDALVTAYVADATRVDRASAPGHPPIIVGREGHTLSFRGACPNTPSPSEAPPASGPSPAPAPTATSTYSCTLDRERDWRTWEYPARGTLLDVWDSYALFFDPHDAAVSLKLYEIDMARAGEVELSDPAVEIVRAGFTDDGRVLVLAQSGARTARRSLVGIGRPGEVLLVRPLGFYAHDVDMGDAQHGLVVGDNAQDIAETVDGGLTWMRLLDVAIEGSPAHLALGSPGAGTGERVRRTGEWVQCNPVACRAGGRLIHRWDDSITAFPALE